MKCFFFCRAPCDERDVGVVVLPVYVFASVRVVCTKTESRSYVKFKGVGRACVRPTVWI